MLGLSHAVGDVRMVGAFREIGGVDVDPASDAARAMVEPEEFVRVARLIESDLVYRRGCPATTCRRLCGEGPLGSSRLQVVPAPNREPWDLARRMSRRLQRANVAHRAQECLRRWLSVAR